MEVFTRPPYRGSKINIRKFQTDKSEKFKTIYVVRNSYDNGYSNYYWTTNLNEKLVRGTICLIDVCDAFKYRFMNYLRLNPYTYFGGDDFDELMQKSIWKDIETQTHLNKKCYNEVMIDNQEIYSEHFDGIIVNDIIENNKDKYIKEILDLIKNSQEYHLNLKPLENIQNYDQRIEKLESTVKELTETNLNLCEIIEKLNKRVKKLESIKSCATDLIKEIVSPIIQDTQINDDDIFN